MCPRYSNRGTAGWVEQQKVLMPLAMTRSCSVILGTLQSKRAARALVITPGSRVQEKRARSAGNRVTVVTCRAIAGGASAGNRSSEALQKISAATIVLR